jgi:hypothetical protein
VSSPSPVLSSEVADALGTGRAVVALESTLLAHGLPRPDNRAAADEVEAAVRAGGGDLLRSVELFDLYRGEQLGAGRKSLALRLEFRADDRTLTDEEVAPAREAIVAAVAERLGGELRG